MTEHRLEAIRRAFDERAPDYDTSAMHLAVADAVARFIDLRGVRDALDVATGTGLVLRALHERTQELRMTGVDISPGMLAVAAHELPSATWIQADAAALPLAPASTDVVTCVTALHILPDATAAVAEWRRVLRPGGRAVTATFLRGAMRPRPPAQQRFPVDHASYETIEALKATFASQGFELERHTTWTDGADAVLIAESRRG